MYRICSENMTEKKWRFGFQLYGQALPCQGCQDRQLVLDSLSRGSNPVNRHLCSKAEIRIKMVGQKSSYQGISRTRRGVLHIPGAIFNARYLHSRSSVRAIKSRRWKSLAECFPKTRPSVLAPSWLSSNRARKTALCTGGDKDRQSYSVPIRIVACVRATHHLVCAVRRRGCTASF